MSDLIIRNIVGVIGALIIFFGLVLTYNSVVKNSVDGTFKNILIYVLYGVSMMSFGFFMVFFSLFVNT